MERADPRIPGSVCAVAVARVAISAISAKAAGLFDGIVTGLLFGAIAARAAQRRDGDDVM
jgi:hypothetical protein